MLREGARIGTGYKRKEGTVLEFGEHDTAALFNLHTAGSYGLRCTVNGDGMQMIYPRGVKRAADTNC